MKKKLSFYSLGLIILVFGHLNIFAQDGIAYPMNKKLPTVKIFDSGKIENFKIEAQDRRKSGENPTATFEVNYEGFTEEAQAAFAEAVKLWSYLVISPVTIKINAKWEPLGTGVLGSAGASTYRRSFKNAPLDSAWYPIAIANKLVGYDLEPDSVDIAARFNSKFSWYLGLDGNCPVFKYDFISVVMHEIGHGLGFVGSGSVEGTMGSWGYESTYPFVFDVFVYNGKDEQLIDETLFSNPSTELKDEYTSNNVFFNSERSNLASPYGFVPLYAPEIWNDGSSYSHLGDVFNGSDNSMMTYSTGQGEVTHNPGPVTLAMFAEMGWINVRFNHIKIKDMEAMTEPILIETEIYSDESIIPGSVLLHYSIDNFITDSIVELTTSNNIKYTATIPVLISDTIKYYFEATAGVNSTYYYPMQGVIPVENINKTLSFIVGADLMPPVIVHEQTKNIFNFNKILDIIIGADDNLGVDSVYIEYKVNENELINLPCNFVGYSALTDLYEYKSSISVEDLQDADTIYYRIVANDLAEISNSSVFPDEGFLKVAILDYGTPISEQVITFDGVDDKNMIISDGLTIFKPDGFASKGLHSPHPYLEGEPFPTDNIEYSAILKSPVILKESKSYIRFDEIVIVEPGDMGSSYGDANFWDYVVVEGSVDSAKTWFSFVDGYDCGISTVFTDAYKTEADGTESMYASHTINLLRNENIVANDIVLIRFRLYSDQLSAGWGWAIDNLEIQPDITSVSDKDLFNAELSVYPNPSKGDFNINVTANDLIENYSVLVYNTLGKQVYYRKNTSSTNLIKHNINISTMPAGIYFVSFNYNNKNISRKIVIE